MSELGAVIEVLGAIDDYVVEHPELVPEVAKLLCPYGSGAAGWYREFRQWLSTIQPSDEFDVESPPDLEAALDELGPHEDEEEPSNRDVALRLLTTAVLDRVVLQNEPQLAADLESKAIKALRDLTRGAENRADERLYALLADKATYPDASRWSDLVRRAIEERLITNRADQPLPCKGEVVEVDIAGQPHAATAITTKFVATELDFNRATAFLDPARWPDCGWAWCAMEWVESAPGGVERYLEKIGTDCPHKPFLCTRLDFRRLDHGGALAVLAYRLSDRQDPGGDGEVVVDEGSIEVRKLTPRGVSVSTTKRVLFKHIKPGPLAMVVCVLGYADVGRLLVYNCAKRGAVADKKGRLAAFAPPTHEHTGDCANIVDEFAALGKRCVADSADWYRDAYRRTAAGEYTSDDAAGDFAQAVKRTAHDVAKAIELGGKAVRAAGEGGGAARKQDPEDAQ